MNNTVLDAITLISSQDDTQSSCFGTGFLVHQENDRSYILTCAHVVEDIGNFHTVVADGIHAEVVCTGQVQGIDLAVLRVNGLCDRKPLLLSSSAKDGLPFVVQGFYNFSSRTNPVLREIKGNLGHQLKFSSSDRKQRITAWDLKIEGKYGLEPGYSGSPVICAIDNSVVGIVSYRIGSGQEGVAIDINALVQVWESLPRNLIRIDSPTPEIPRPLPLSVRRKIERLERDKEFVEKQVSELDEIIKTITEETNENVGDLVRVRNLNKKKSRYEDERVSNEEKIENICIQIEKLQHST